MEPKAIENKNLLFDKESAHNPNTFLKLRNVIFRINEENSDALLLA